MNKYLDLTKNRELLIYAKLAGSRKLKAGITVTEGPVECWAYWDDGSRDQWHKAGQPARVSALPAPSNPPQFGGKAYLATPTPDTLIIRTGTFCGKQATPHFYVHPESPWASLAVRE